MLDQVAQNIGALGFFVDALAQNVDGARRRYRFDDAAQLFRELPYEAQPVAAALPAEAVESLPAGTPNLCPAPAPAAALPQDGDAVEAELLEIFIGEAREVLGPWVRRCPQPRTPGDQDTLTRLRRAFHTLKGSGRMVGLEQFALVAAAVEKTMNVWLAEARGHAGPAGAARPRPCGTGRLGRGAGTPAASRQRDGAALRGCRGARAGRRRRSRRPKRSSASASAGSRSRCRCITSTSARPRSWCACWPRDFAAWRAEPLRAASVAALKAAHTLGGTSATVGFQALRALASRWKKCCRWRCRRWTMSISPAARRTVERVRIMLQVFGLGEPAPAQPELLARLDALRDELGRRRADAVLDGADPELAARLDALFAAAYDSILADPPLAGSTAGAGRRHRTGAARAGGRAGRSGRGRSGRPVRHLFRRSVRRAGTGAGGAGRRSGACGVGTGTRTRSRSRSRIEFEAEPEGAGPVLATEPVFVDELDPDLLPVFMEEATDLLPQIGKACASGSRTRRYGAAHGLLRALHTVKGSARMAGAMRLGQHTHALETQIENMLHAGTTNPAAFDELLANYDQAQLLFEQLQQPAERRAAGQAACRRRRNASSSAGGCRPRRRRWCACAPTSSTAWSTRPAKCRSRAPSWKPRSAR
jgi:chemosensory pili system protein ChpA (sensor histidine kinase/response regulator)